MDNKWYSNKLSDKEAEIMGVTYAKIERPVYGINDRDQLSLQFHLVFANGRATDSQLTGLDDIKQLLSRTKSFEVPRLEGKIIEAYIDGFMLKGLSVNENLI